MAAVVLAAGPAVAWEAGRPAWELTLMAGPVWLNNTSDIFAEADFGETWGAAGVAATRSMLRLLDTVDVAVEAQVFGRTGGEGLIDLAGLAVARWQALEDPDLRVSVGFGPSWAYDRPERVADRDDELSDWLGLLMAEVALAPDPQAPWSIGLRYQHWSSTFGLFGSNGAKDDGTAFLLALKYRFGP